MLFVKLYKASHMNIFRTIIYIFKIFNFTKTIKLLFHYTIIIIIFKLLAYYMDKDQKKEYGQDQWGPINNFAL